jgi:hypothetical protein
MSNIDQRPENVRGMIGMCLRLTANRKIKPTTGVSLNCLATVDIRRPRASYFDNNHRLARRGVMVAAGIGPPSWRACPKIPLIALGVKPLGLVARRRADPIRVNKAE